MAKVSIDPISDSGPWELSTDEEHVVELRRRRARVLRAPELHFNHDSALFLPEHGNLDEPATQDTPSGIDVLCRALRWSHDEASHKLLIVGHTDSSGSSDYNVDLANARADVVRSLLTGDRETWQGLADERSKSVDVLQTLRWVSLARGWPCYASEVSGKGREELKQTVSGFQRAYNEEFDASLKVDGIMGEATWGGVFDVYMQELEIALEAIGTSLSGCREKIQFISARETFGHGEPASSSDGASPNRDPRARRVELLYFTADDEPPASALARGGDYKVRPPFYEFELIPVRRGPAWVWISVQTVGELGFRLGAVDLVFRSGVQEKQVTTNANGAWSGRVPSSSGSIEVTTADGKPLRLGNSLDQGTKVQVNPRLAHEAVTDLMVLDTVDPNLVAEHRRQRSRYDSVRPAQDRGGSFRAGVNREHRTSAESWSETSSRGGDYPKLSGREYAADVADNLFLAAGGALEELVPLLDEWLADYFGEVRERGYFLQVIQGTQVFLYEEGGRVDDLRIREGVQVHGRFGAHALVEMETKDARSDALFVDMAHARTKLQPIDASTGKVLETQEENSEARESRVIDIRTIFADDDREAYSEWISEGAARKKLAIVYLFPSREQLARPMMTGGTGLLEAYPNEGDVREHVHNRNKSVVKYTSAFYKGYIDEYVATVERIDPDPSSPANAALPHPEVQLHSMGPPYRSPVFPRPPGATDQEYEELIAEADGASAYRAYKAVNEKLNQIWGRRTAGSAWLVCEFTFDKSAGTEYGGAKGEIKFNFEASTDSHDAVKVDTKAGGSIVLGPEQLQTSVDENGVPKVSAKGGKLGPFGVEATADGKVKMTYGGVMVEHDPSESTVGMGYELSLRDLVRKKKDWGALGEPPWVEELPDVKMKVAGYIQLARRGDIEDFLVPSLTFWEKRPRSEFRTLDWRTLDPDEKWYLETLGFDQESWDFKQLPDSATTEWTALSFAEQQAARNLPVPRHAEWVPYWEKLRSDFAQGAL